MVKTILRLLTSDAELSRLFENAREYADIYVLTSKRKKGCDGMGELSMARDELRDSVDELVRYCAKKEYLSRDIHYDIDSVAEELSES